MPLTQVHHAFIVASTDNGFILIHQQHAHERILYERLNEAANGKQMPAQQSLFPSTIELNVADSVLMLELLPDMKVLGYMIEPFGNNTFVVQGTPADILQGNEKIVIELLLEQYKYFSSDIKFTKREKLVRCVAKQQAIKSGKALTQKEMTVLAEELFNCEFPNITPGGNATYIDFSKDYLETMFGR